MVTATSIRRRCVALALVLMLAAASPGCGRHGESAGGSTTAATPITVASPPAQFVAGPCARTPEPVPLLDNARCGVLVVPESRTAAGGRTLRLAVAIIPSETQPPTAEPIVFLDGGPGADAIVEPPVPADVGINRHRDLILMSQRGDYSSEPALTCPEVDEFSARRVGLVFGAPSTGDAYVRAVTACHDRLAQKADLAAFNTTESAADLSDLRTALGIGKWDVFSHSYGTELALFYMRKDHDAIRSVVLDGVVPPPVQSLGWTWSSAREALDNMAKACDAQPACKARYPDLAEKFVAQVSRLESQPATTTVDVPEVGKTDVVLDGNALLAWFVPLATHFPADFPAAIDELAQGNPQRIAQRWADTRLAPGTSGVFGHGLGLSIWCSEWVPFESVEDQLAKAKEAFPELPASVRAQAPQLAFLREACAAWNVPKAPDDVRAITESDIPTLVLSGSFDGQTGAQWGHYVAQHLSHATEVTVPGVAHGVFVTPCGAQVVASFFDDPQRPDTSCVASTQPPPFLITPPPP